MVAQKAPNVLDLPGPVLFPSLLLSYFRKWPKSAVLGSQMAPSGNGPVTGGFQPKNDFFGPSLVLSPLTSPETPTILQVTLGHMPIAKSLFMCQDEDKNETENESF